MATSSISNQKTMQTIINETSKKSSERKTGGDLGKDDFLNLLVTQLRYQDPLKPVDDKEFISQMAQFTSLEQMQNLNSTFSSNKAFSLIGKSVKANIVDETTNEMKEIQGSVTSVKIEKDVTYLVVKGKDVPVDKVVEVNDGQTSSFTNLTGFANLIGSKISGFVYDSQTGNTIAANGTVKSVQRGVYEDYAVLDGVEFEMSDVLSEAPSTDPEYKKNYLEAKIGEEVEIMVVDRISGQKAPIKAILDQFNIAKDGTIKVKLNSVQVPLESIENIQSASAGSLSAFTGLIGFKASGSVHDEKFRSFVNVHGEISSIKAGENENLALMNGVSVRIVSVVTTEQSADPNFKADYLKRNEGNEVTVVIQDPQTGAKVQVKGILQADSMEVNEATGNISAVLNAMEVPVTSITSVEKN